MGVEDENRLDCKVGGCGEQEKRLRREAAVREGCCGQEEAETLHLAQTRCTVHRHSFCARPRLSDHLHSHLLLHEKQATTILIFI